MSARTLKMPKCGIFNGEAAVVGKGRSAYLRIEVIQTGKPTGLVGGCAWADNNEKTRKWLRDALKRMEA